ncbi:recombinase family protein [Pseudomonas sp. FP1740]|nr:recombinase family protein [Pseudomonas sp. FP1740]WLG43182.1 recombinase family protein [Pseudomonas sp. FP1740]
MTGTNRSRPGLDQALAAVRCGDTLVDQKPDRLARSVRGAADLADSLIARDKAGTGAWGAMVPKTNASFTTATQRLLPRRPLR